MPVDPTKLDANSLRRTPKQEVKPEPKPPSVNQGAIDKITDLAFNPSRDKMREFTSIDRIQAKWLPQLDIVDQMWHYFLEVAAYRTDYDTYREVFEKDYPEAPEIFGEFTYRTAQWQKSIAANNLKAAMELALAEKEREFDDNEPDWTRGINDE